jgi:hypothetical protein
MAILAIAKALIYLRHVRVALSVKIRVTRGRR